MQIFQLELDAGSVNAVHNALLQHAIAAQNTAQIVMDQVQKQTAPAPASTTSPEA
jgi:hypothetical protein